MTAVQKIKRWTFNMPFTILLGLAVGGAMVPIGGTVVDGTTTIYDRVFPVVEMNGTLISYAHEEAVIALAGRKLRDCDYVRVQAYSLGADGNMSDAFIVRIDAPESGITRPRGNFLIGAWRVWPLKQSRGIAIYLHHFCGSRFVLSKAAEIPLPLEPLL